MACALGDTERDEGTDAVILNDLPGPGDKLAYVGDYEILEEIAHGGMGVVYKARQQSLGRIVALKMLNPAAQATDEMKRRFRNEAETASHLRHPNIVPIFEVGEHKGQPYFSMEYVAGTDLEKLVRENGPLPPDQAARYTQQVAEAIKYAHTHEQAVWHRDLKPANILIGADDRPRVTDFGLAKQVGSKAGLTLAGQALGTPGYLPPEQASSTHGVVGPQSDVYALGAVLYYLLTGHPPFLASTTQDTIEQVLRKEPVPLRTLNPAIPRDLETICLTCLHKRARDRYDTAQALSQDLARWQRNEPILIRRANLLDRAGKWCRREPALAWALASVMLIILTGSGLAVWQRQAAREMAAVALAERDAAERLNSFLSDSLREDLARAGRADLLAGLSRQLQGYYNGFSNAAPVAARSLNQARALLMEGDVQREKNSLPRALASYQEAERQLAGLPRTEELDLVLSRIHRRMADALLKQGETTNALARVDLALQREPTNQLAQAGLEWRRARADALAIKAEILHDRGHFKDSAATGRAALALAKSVAADQPNDQSSLEELVKTLVTHGQNFESGWAVGAENEAAAVLAEAAAACQRGMTAWPENPMWEARLLMVESLLSARQIKSTRLMERYSSMTNGISSVVGLFPEIATGTIPSDLSQNTVLAVVGSLGAATVVRQRVGFVAASASRQRQLIGLAFQTIAGLEDSTNKQAALKATLDLLPAIEALSAEDPTSLDWKKCLWHAWRTAEELQNKGCEFGEGDHRLLGKANSLAKEVLSGHPDLRWWQDHSFLTSWYSAWLLIKAGADLSATNLSARGLAEIDATLTFTENRMMPDLEWSDGLLWIGVFLSPTDDSALNDMKEALPEPAWKNYRRRCAEILRRWTESAARNNIPLWRDLLSAINELLAEESEEQAPTK